LESRIIVLWGKNVVTSFLHMMPILKEARSRGTFIALIDPVPNKTSRFADLVLRPRPGTDRFLALGVARTLYERGLIDPTLGRWRAGVEEFGALGLRHDASEWARAGDAAPAELAALAAAYGERRPGNIQVGWGLQRRLHGAATIRALDALAALTGNYGVPG